MLIAIGNSHVHFFTGGHPGSAFSSHPTKQIISYSIGPTIAYNFFEHHLPHCIQKLNNHPPSKEIFIVPVVGEVDCRWHIPKQAELQNRDVLDVASECIERLFRCHLHLKEMGYNVVGWGGHPSTTNGHNDNPSCPVYGSCLIRNGISKFWNDKMKALCSTNGVQFISIFEHLITKEGLKNIPY